MLPTASLRVQISRIPVTVPRTYGQVQIGNRTTNAIHPLREGTLTRGFNPTTGYISPGTKKPRMTMEPGFQPLEGLIAVNKPKGISSGDAIRQLVRLFTASSTFTTTLTHESHKRALEAHNQRNRRKNKRIEVKVGHGGTLDPMATGVLVIGIGGGTKYLQNFLNGSKTYLTKAMFGCETDTYDAMGKILRRAEHAHIDKEMVEKALDKFRGEIMQKPPLYSALHHEGKRYYEYAREGIPLPVEIKERPVKTLELELTEFTREHGFKFPEEEAEEEVKLEAEALDKLHHDTTSTTTANAGEKHEREGTPEESAAKKSKTEETTGPNPPVASISMTVTKGFYVRSLVYDLGLELNSAAHMVALIRTRQADWELGKNVFEWEELMEQGEEVWGKKVEGSLRAWWAKKGAPDGIVTAEGVFVSKEERKAQRMKEDEERRKEIEERKRGMEAEREERRKEVERNIRLMEEMSAEEVKGDEARAEEVKAEEVKPVEAVEKEDVKMAEEPAKEGKAE